ncbi:hypothetical protein B566_EDAN006533 [Ephemera danica]|nr:hypothetical protein B566_EDAN006533 [Ephemera danica]
MWQKCWNTNQSLVHNLRFRERGPLKSWRPETMAEAIFSVLKEGLSLSQAARKYDIPYPTFVLYANRVHNMLGPSADGGADLRPKGRGRPQRILLGVWPEEHIRGVIRAVVFRDPQNIKEEAQTLARLYCLQDPLSQSPQGYSTSNGPGGDSGSRSVTPTPGSAAAAAVAAVAQGLRQQMCGLAAGGEGGSQQGPNAAAAAAALASAILGREAAESMQHAGASLNNNTLSALMNNGVPRNLSLGNVGVGGMPYKPGMFAPPRPENLFQEDIEDIVKSPLMDSMDESDSMHQQVKSDQVLEASAD